jgi:hypothetical protein
MDQLVIPGPDRTDPIELVGDYDFRAEISLNDWPLIGSPAAVRRKRQGPWLGSVLSFRRSQFYVAEWFLASGERREMQRIAPKDDEGTVGDTFTVQMGANSWTATVITSEPATTVRIEYTVTSGKQRRADFHRRGELNVFGKPTDDGGMAFYRFRDPQ